MVHLSSQQTTYEALDVHPPSSPYICASFTTHIVQTYCFCAPTRLKPCYSGSGDALAMPPLGGD